ncbi:hypothetical protein GGX14DRAFT_397512 [Mycena pura]|uniref:Uncharacterized protein n=1 Tax=Mycena pura TaxID=153505 RepID=A0AAD6V8L8_9AGAR|nr:hypothetical protein GGX14DRAFT_397512 [Mycena pura]
MARVLSSRQARVSRLIRVYLWLRKSQIKRRIRKKNKLMRILARAGYTEQEREETHLRDMATDSDSSGPSLSLDLDSDSSNTTTSSDSGGWSDVLGSDWRDSSCSESSEDSSSLSSESDSEYADDEMSDACPVGYLLDDGYSDGSDDSDDSTASSDVSSVPSDNTAGLHDEEYNFGMRRELELRARGGQLDYEHQRAGSLLNFGDVHSLWYKEQSIGGLGTLQIGIETMDMSRGWGANNRSRGKRLQQRISSIESRSVTGTITDLPGII